MHKASLSLVPICLFIALIGTVEAKTELKPGLWEMTTSLTRQRLPLLPGVSMPVTEHSPFQGSKSKSLVCVSQEMIERYGAPIPPIGGDCNLTSLKLNSKSMTAKISCSPGSSVLGSIKSSWSGTERATSTIHVTGMLPGKSTRMGPEPPETSPTAYPMDSWREVRFIYKGPDCGSAAVLPMPMVGSHK